MQTAKNRLTYDFESKVVQAGDGANLMNCFWLDLNCL
jgi:hypothetical protein